MIRAAVDGFCDLVFVGLLFVAPDAPFSRRRARALQAVVLNPEPEVLVRCPRSWWGLVDDAGCTKE